MRFATLLFALFSSCAPDGPTAPKSGGSQTTSSTIANSSPKFDGAPHFATRRERALTEKPEALLAADFDGDGFVDLAAATLEPGALFVWRGSKQGIAHDATRLAIGGYPLAPIALEAGAFGAAPNVRRIVVASRADRSLSLIDLTLAKPIVESQELASVPRALAGGRLGGEVSVVALLDGKQAALWRKDSPLAISALGDGLPRCARVLDDGSGVVVGFQDIERAEPAHRVDFVPYSSESRTLADRAAFELPLRGFPRAIDELDLDRDGKPEIVVLGGDASAWIFGFGRDWRSQSGRTPLEWRTNSVPYAIAHADFDGDGALDLAVLSNADLSFEIWRDFAKEGPRSRSSGYAGQLPFAIATGDFDGDGVLDLAFANRDAARVSLIFGDGHGAMTTPISAPAGTFPNCVVAVDLEHEKRCAALALSAKSTELSLERFDDRKGTRVFAHAVGPAPSSLVARDFDGDGELDAAWISSGDSGARLEVRLGGKTHDFARALAPRAIGKSGAALAALDVDRDGKLDLVAADPDENRLVVFENSGGDDPFARAPLEFALDGAPVALAALDARQSDGAPELAVVLGAPGAKLGVVVVGFEKSATDAKLALHELAFVPIAGAPIDVAAAKFASGSRRDLAVLSLDARGSVAGSISTFAADTANGALTYRALEKLATGLQPKHVATGDLDGDGIDDVGVAAQNSHAVNLWFAKRDGPTLSFRRDDDLGAGLGVIDLAFGDADGDGRLDVFVADAGTNDIALILNRAR